MKKFIALFMTLALVFTLCCCAFAEDADKEIIEYDETLSFAMRYPDGYTAETIVSDGIMCIFISSSEDENAARYSMLVAPSEDYAEVERLNDLSDDEIAAFAKYMAGDLADPVYEVRETGLGSKLLIMQEKDVEMPCVSLNSLYHGYMLVTYVAHLDGEDVTDADIETGIQIYTDMDFIE